jgi:hypothetical protein
VSDGQEFLVFLARSKIRDFRGQADNGPVKMALGLPVDISWHSRWSEHDDQQLQLKEALNLEVKPKEASRPVVTYRPPSLPLHYRLGNSIESGDIQAGAYVFRSVETLKFAKSFRGDFSLAAKAGGRAVTGKAISLLSGLVTLAPGEELANPVVVHCGSQEIINPEPPYWRLDYYCLGPAAPDSDMSPQSVQLLRDPSKSRLDLLINKGWFDTVDPARRIAREIYWGEDGAARWRWADASEEGDYPFSGTVIRLEPRSAKFKRDEFAARTVMTLQAANSARNGRGRVELTVRAKLELDAAYARVIRDIDDNVVDASSLISLTGEDGEAISKQIVLNEGAPAFNINVGFQVAAIDNILEAVIPSGKAVLIVAIEARIWIDEDVLSGTRNASYVSVCRFETPLDIELLPPDTWLAIDFGTSAITVARNDSSGRLVVTDLQRVVQQDKSASDWCLEKFDPENAELGTHFMPSAVTFDADLRQDGSQSRGFPGFPQFAPASLAPGDASFVSLPTRAQLDAEREKRVVHSLKSWFATGSKNVVLETPVKVRRTGAGTTETRELPTTDAMASTFAALAQAYISPDHADAGRVIVTHPNTLSSIQVERFLDVARNSLAVPLNIPRPERFSAVSESDAVAYHYTRRLRSSQPPPQDTLLVYDFGAGTLDLSVIRIGWEDSPNPQPKTWRTLARVGVPVAGNHIDMLLAACLHKALVDPNQIDQAYWDYQYPIVADRLSQSAPEEHRRAMLGEVWRGLRAAKHQLPEDRTKITQEEFVVRLELPEGRRRDSSVIRPRADLNRDTAVQDASKKAVRTSGKGENERTEIAIPIDSLFGDPALSKFIRFATIEVVAEVLSLANIKAESVTSVVISGRGALWPGLRKAVWDQFPNADKPDLLSGGSSEEMKNAVVQGAIEFQRINRFGWLQRDDSAARPRLVVVLEQGGKKLLLDEPEWTGKSINIGGAFGGTIYQASVALPKVEDFDGYRRHFYARVPHSGEIFADGFAVDGMVRLNRREGVNGTYVIEATNRDGNTVWLDGKVDRYDLRTLRPDWPVGVAIIRPGDLE